MDSIKWLADLLAAGIGGLIGGTVGAYLKSYWSEKGKNLATYRDIEFLLTQERGKAYEQQKGKRLATHEDIENVLREVKAVTRETEAIKAQITGDLWTKQMIWQQKRQAYLTIIREAHQLLTSLSDLEDWAKKNPTVPENNAGLSEALSKHWACMSRLDIAFSEAEIVVNAATISVLQEFRSKSNTFVRLPEDCLSFAQFLGVWVRTVVQTSKQDLGITK